MSHESGHIIITLTTPMDSRKPKGPKAWHCALGIFAIGVLVGFLLFA